MSMNGWLPKHSLKIGDRNTSICLEPEFWDEIRRLAALREVNVGQLIHEIDIKRRAEQIGNLSSAVRVHVVRELMAAAGVDHA